MRHKMKSRQACYDCIYNDNYTISEDFEIWGINNVPKTTLNRYVNYGMELRIGNDEYTFSGPEWTFPHLNYTQLCDTTIHKYFTNVRSQYLYVKTVSQGCKFVKDECAVHYCKVLSPA